MPDSDRDMPDFPKPDKGGHFTTVERGAGGFCPRNVLVFPSDVMVLSGLVTVGKRVLERCVERLLPGLKNFFWCILMHFGAFRRGTPGWKPSPDSWYRTKDEAGKAQLSADYGNHIGIIEATPTSTMHSATGATEGWTGVALSRRNGCLFKLYAPRRGTTMLVLPANMVVSLV